MGVTGHFLPQVDSSPSAFGGIATSAVIPDSRRLYGPERVCEQRIRWRRTTMSMELAVNFGVEGPALGSLQCDFDVSTGDKLAAAGSFALRLFITPL